MEALSILTRNLKIYSHHYSIAEKKPMGHPHRLFFGSFTEHDIYFIKYIS